MVHYSECLSVMNCKHLICSIRRLMMEEVNRKNFSRTRDVDAHATHT